MLIIEIPVEPERFDESTSEFIDPVTKTLQLEHSLISLSKWESKWHKPFLSQKERTEEENLDYIRCMTITQNVDPDIYNHLSIQNVEEINRYIYDEMTATTFREDKTKKNNREIITSELIYYWMIALQIPVQFEKWHLNRLLTLIRVCEIKNEPPKKRGRNQLISDYAALNEARKKKLGSRG